MLGVAGSHRCKLLVAYQFRYIFAEWIPVAAPWRVFVAMLLLFLLTSSGIWVIFQWVARFIDRLKLKEFDRQIRALLGLAKGVILCVIITMFAVALLGDNQRQMIVNSRSGFYIARLLDRSKVLLPEEIDQVLEPFRQALERGVQGPTGELSEQGRDLPWQAPPWPARVQY